MNLPISIEAGFVLFFSYVLRFKTSLLINSILHILEMMRNGTSLFIIKLETWLKFCYLLDICILVVKNHWQLLTSDNNKAVPKKRVTIKLKPAPIPQNATVINISPDTVEERPKSESSALRKKNPHSSLTATLAAPSKAACGLDYKPKPKNIVDIDAGDVNNELAEAEYVEDIYKSYKLVENENKVHDYMNSQPEINEKMRAILIDWLIEVHNKFELSNETLYLTIHIVDHFLAAERWPEESYNVSG